MYAVLLDISFFLFLVQRHASVFRASLEGHVNHRLVYFLRTRGKRVASTTVGPPAQGHTG